MIITYDVIRALAPYFSWLLHKIMEHISWYVCLNLTLELFYLYFSIKFLKEDEWLIDPVMIADTYGPEVSPFLLFDIKSII
jgi:hypothetical protein